MNPPKYYEMLHRYNGLTFEDVVKIIQIEAEEEGYQRGIKENSDYKNGIEKLIDSNGYIISEIYNEVCEHISERLKYKEQRDAVLNCKRPEEKTIHKDWVKDWIIDLGSPILINPGIRLKDPDYRFSNDGSTVIKTK